MANKGTINKYITPNSSGTGAYYYTDEAAGAVATIAFNWEVISQDVVNCTTTIDWTYTLTVHNDNNGAFEYIKANDFDVIWETNIPGRHSSDSEYIKPGPSSPADYTNVYPGQTFTKGSGTHTFAHAEDGTRTVGIIIYGGVNGGYKVVDGTETRIFYMYSSTFRTETSITLDAIAKHAIITSAPTTFTDEQRSVSVGYAMPSGMSAQIYLSLSGNANTESTHLVTVTGAGTHTYTFTDTDRRQMWALLDEGLDNKQVRFFIKSTGDDGLLYREPSNPINLRIVNYMPTLDTRVIDSNPVSILLTGDEEKLIRYVSTAKFTTGAQAKKHYSIATESCTPAGGNTVYGATGEIPNITSNFFTFSATDNAGRRVQTVHEVPEGTNWIPYVKLTCAATPTEMTADGEVAVTVSGKYFDGNFSQTRPNKMYLSYEISKNNAEPEIHNLGAITPQVEGSDYTYTFIIPELEYLSVYDLTIKVSDEVLTEGTVAHTILASTPIFDWGRQDFNFNVPVTITEDEVVASVPSIVEQGTSYSGWGYRKWSDGLYECWQRKVVPAMIGNDSSAAGWYSSGAILATNLSYPITFVEMPTVNVSLTPTTNTWALVVPGSTPGTTEETGVFQLLATYNHEFANRDYIFNYQVKGKWK